MCETPKLKGKGVLKLDLCGRRYCGVPKSHEPFEKREYNHKRMACDFKVVNNICRCVAETKR
jgi:hypothetical protein